jgi:hypothetical protein
LKSLTFILGVFILFLAVEPGIDLLLLQVDTEQTCCGRQYTPIECSDNAQDQNEGKDCNRKSCNPFQVCSSCVLVCFNIALISITKPTVISNQGFTYQTTFPSQFVPDFWQPPKIV